MSAVLKLFDDPDRPGHGGGDRSPPVDPFVVACAVLLAGVGNLPARTLRNVTYSVLADQGADSTRLDQMGQILETLPEAIDAIKAQTGNGFTMKVTITPNACEPNYDVGTSTE